MRHRLLLRWRTGLPAAVLLVALSGGAVPAAADAGIIDDPLVLATAAVWDGTPVDEIPAGPMVAGGFHIHAHLSIFVDGVQAWVPAGVGVTRPIVLDPARPDPVVTAAVGYYWLHTHDESGVIHAEAPQPHAFTLGQFFDIWGQPLSRYRVGPAQGEVSVWVDGQPVQDDPRFVAITSHATIQLNVGQDVAFQPYRFPPNF